MRYVLILMMVLFSSQAVALNCEKQPTCEELNYSKEDDPQCAEDGYVLCPFDFSYKKCLQPDCESLGFTQSEKSDWCADIAHCITDSAYTACQSPCLATTYEELSTLAESGKCKVITMKNDITIPANQDITLAKNTTLDGGGHTITATLTSFTLLDGAKLKNMHINRKISSTEELTLISVQGNGIFEDLSVLDENSNIAQTENWRALCQISGTVTLSGVLKFEVKNDVKHSIFKDASQIILENANIELIAPSLSSDAFSYVGKVVSKNSEIHITTNSFVIASRNNEQIELIDSKMIVKHAVAFSWVGKGEYTFKLGEGGYLDTKNAPLLYVNNTKLKFIFNGTAENPATLIIAKEHKEDDVTLDVQNTAAEFKYMGTTYRPTHIGTTKLSEIPNSQNWKKE